MTVLDRTLAAGRPTVPFATDDWDGTLGRFPTGIGAGTTYPDYKPAPFIVSREVEGADVVTVVTEAIFSYCGAKVKIDTDRHLGPEAATVRANGEADRPRHHRRVRLADALARRRRPPDRRLQGRGQRHLDTLLALCAREPVDLAIDGGATLTVAAGRPPVVDGVPETRMRVGCGSAAIGMFASQWAGLVDEVVVVDDAITGVVSEHQAGRVLDWQPTGIRIRGHRSTPGRYFRVADPGRGWGGTTLSDPLAILAPFDARRGARPGLHAADGLDHRRGARLLRARRRPRPPPPRPPRRARPDDRADRRELRAVARHGAVRAGAGGSLAPASPPTRCG